MLKDRIPADLIPERRKCDSASQRKSKVNLPDLAKRAENGRFDREAQESLAFRSSNYLHLKINLFVEIRTPIICNDAVTRNTTDSIIFILLYNIE